MHVYKTKAKRLSGTRYREIYDAAFGLYSIIQKHTKRRPYVRSAYFQKQKVFIDVFRGHLHEKNWRDRARRLRFFPAAIELLQYSRLSPESKPNPNSKEETLHRFTGQTADGHVFYVQVKDDTRSGNRSLLSVFPEQKHDTIRR